jgi:hypothetical protein
MHDAFIKTMVTSTKLFNIKKKLPRKMGTWLVMKIIGIKMFNHSSEVNYRFSISEQTPEFRKKINFLP